MVGDKMKDYKLTDNEIYLIKLAIAERIIDIKRKIDRDEDIETNKYLKTKYHKLLNSIEIAERYNK